MDRVRVSQRTRGCVILLCLGLLLVGSSAETATQRCNGEGKEFFFLVAGIFKNEAANMFEWISHYLLEGAEHIYLIDNGSSDHFMEIAQPFIDAGQVTLMVNKKRHSQNVMHDHYLWPLRPLSEWMLIIDLDEFVYARTGTIPAYLQTVPCDVGKITLGWKMYGSSFHKDQPQGSIVKNFRMRNNNGFNRGVKTVFRTSMVTGTHVHDPPANGTHLFFEFGKICGEDVACMQEDSAPEQGASFLQMNHYPIQSLEWFVRTKMRRGDVAAEGYDNVRNFDYFERFDNVSNQVEDLDLYYKHRNLYDSV